MQKGFCNEEKEKYKKLLNLSILDYTNLTTKIGEYDLPYIVCNTNPQIDYLATYSQPSTYFKTPNTAISFFEFDPVFDGLYGLWNGIYYGVKEIQEFYIERFRGVKYFIAPDCSKVGDSLEAENQHRQLKMRIISIWLAMELDAIVIPLVSCADDKGLAYMLDGMENCVTVAFNAKGPMGDPEQMPIFKKSIYYTVDHLPKLENIIVYSASPNIEALRNIFNYAIEKGVEVQVPDNMLQSRNRILGGGSYGFN